MAAYLLVQEVITDQKLLEEYVGLVTPIIEKFGGRYLSITDAARILEGTWPNGTTVVIEFPSMKVAQEWYDSDEYAKVKPMRLKASKGNLVLVEGGV